MYSIPCFNFFIKWCWAREWCPLKLIVLVNEAPGPEGNILFISESWSRLSFLKYEFQSNIVCAGGSSEVRKVSEADAPRSQLWSHNSCRWPAAKLSNQPTPAQRWTKKVQLSDFHLAQLPPLSLCPGQLKMMCGSRASQILRGQTSLTRKNTGKAFVGKNDHPVLVTWYSDLVACVARVAWVELEILSEWHFYESHIG